MKRRKVIIITECCTGVVRCYGNFKKMCEAESLPYHSLKMLKFPIHFKDKLIIKTELL